MPSFSKNLDVVQGFNFKKDKQTPVGFITSLKIADSTITADIAVKDPLNPTTDLKCAAVCNSFLWDTGTTDALYFSGQVSVANKQLIAQLTYLDMTKVEVLIKFDVYDYDPLQKKYFKCATCGDSELKGILEKNGQDLTLSIAEDASTEVQSPINYSFQAGIKPQPTAQTITLAVGDQKTFVKSWGIQLG